MPGNAHSSVSIVRQRWPWANNGAGAAAWPTVTVVGIGPRLVSAALVGMGQQNGCMVLGMTTFPAIPAPARTAAASVAALIPATRRGYLHSCHAALTAAYSYHLPERALL